MTDSSSDYGFFSRLLHDLVLSRPSVGEFLFDIESTGKQEGGKAPAGPHVLVSGCARAGTTLVTNLLYQTSLFASLTYRDMPFAMAPATWSRISLRDAASKAPRIRAHNDGVEISYDSPEAFEEIFWRTFDPGYFKRAELGTQQIDVEVTKRYRQFVYNVLRAKAGTRYLAKNNNAVVRLGVYLRAFPETRVVIVFRNPLAQSRSLLRQHEQFLEVHRRDPFSLRYMEYLGHFEFGQAHKPFVFARPVDESLSPHQVEYWLDRWMDIYAHVLREAAILPDGNIVFLNYDRLVSDPRGVWHEVAQDLELGEMADLDRVSASVRHGAVAPQPQPESDREREAYEIFRALCARADG